MNRCLLRSTPALLVLLMITLVGRPPVSSQLFADETATDAPRQYFLAIGGGPYPYHNEASLEANMRYVQRLLDDAQLPQEHRHILFADGGNAAFPDLQYLDPDHEAPAINRELALLYETLHELDYRYRPSDVDHVAGPADTRHIDRWFADHGDSLGPGDRLIIYYTGHGGPGSDESPRNTTLSLWRDRPLTVQQLSERLDRLHPEVQVVLVMVQCHSGWFADVLYQSADDAMPLVDHARLGFFAAPYDRLAAGCTPEIDEASYEDYSTYFFAASLGRTRTGEPVDDADIDNDGQVSLAEAHAYVLLNAETIDIPVTTVDAFLRNHSRLGGRRQGQLLNADRDYLRIRDAAEPHHRAVLEGLSRQLELAGNDRLRTARRALQQLGQEQNQLGREYRRAQQTLDEARDRIFDDLLYQWPQLDHLWQPHLHEWLEEHGDRILADIRAHPAHSRMWEAIDQMQDLSDARHALSTRAALYHRLLHVAETVALAHNLEAVADDHHVQKYRQLTTAQQHPLLIR